MHTKSNILKHASITGDVAIHASDGADIETRQETGQMSSDSVSPITPLFLIQSACFCMRFVASMVGFHSNIFTLGYVSWFLSYGSFFPNLGSI